MNADALPICSSTTTTTKPFFRPSFACQEDALLCKLKQPCRSHPGNARRGF